MKLSEKNILILIFLLFFLAIFTKSLLNGIKILQELSSNPSKPTIVICPSKTPDDFKHVADGGYLYALYRYEGIGVKCKKN